ncbi:MAG: hypothetical protein ACI88H_003782 [Cocleimonas sp.]|jgi:hypothetical protein
MDTRKFDTLFDSGRDITEYLELDKATRPSQQSKRINVDFPSWIILALDKEAKRIGITRQSLIKVWLAERLQKPN